MGEGSIDAYVHVSVLHGMEQEVLPILSEIPGVKRVSTVYGGFIHDGSIIAEIRGDDEKGLYDTILEMRRVRGVMDTSTSIIQEYKKQ